MDITITIDDTEIQQRLSRLLTLTGNLKPVMEEIGQRYERSVLENFRGERSPDGTPWPRLSKVTLLMGLSRKNRIGKRGGLTQKGRTYLQNKKMLVGGSGFGLRDSIHHQSDNTSVTIGVPEAIKYGRIHQFGGMAGRNRKVRIPARPYLAVNRGEGFALADKDRDMVIGVLDRHIREASK